MAQETLLITGAAGFIGSHLAKVCLDHGHKVVGFDNLNDYYDPTLKQARLNRLLPIPGFLAYWIFDRLRDSFAEEV